jgi:hypothetical protein
MPQGYLLLPLAEGSLTVLAEELGDAAADRLLDRRVDVHMVARDPLGDLARERRLPRAHEADQSEVPV